MAIKIVVPELGESVLEATVSHWLKKEGDFVNVGDVLVELETDKVNLEVGAKGAGILQKIEAAEGQDVKVGDVLGTIDENADQPKASAPQPVAEKIETKQVEKEKEQPASRGDGREKERQAAPQVSPVASRLARDRNVDISKISGTGPEGRVTKADVESYLREQEKAKENERLTTFNEIDMSAVMDLRKRRNEEFQKRYGIKLGFMSFFVKAAISALRAFPQVNAEIDGDEIVFKHYYDIGMAVGSSEGLVVPVIRNADGLSFAEIEKQIKDFVEKTEQGKLSVEDLRGGTFTVTNGGVFGSLLSTPILNPPQVGILGLHKIEERPIVQNGQIVIRPMMYVALSYDHRLVDGREAVQFLVHIKQLLEDPAWMLVEG